MTTTLRIEPDLKRSCDAIFDELGLTMSGAITIFLKQVARTGGIPFQLTTNIPNAEVQALLNRITEGAEPLSGPFQSAKEAIDFALKEEADA